MGKKIIQQDEKERHLTLSEIKDIISIIRRNNILEFDLEQGGMRLKVITGKDTPDNSPASSASHPVLIHSMPSPMYSAQNMPQITMPKMEIHQDEIASTMNDKDKNKAIEKAVEAEGKNYFEIKSPMVGTFYRAPAPDAPPYVDPGDFVTTDSVLCIVEAMKLMNEIKCEVRGTVRKILVENGHPVEFGQVLFLIEPSA